MNEKPDYARDITEIRSMMERSSKFLSLSGLAGVMAGMYALAGAFIAYRALDFNPGDLGTATDSSLWKIVVLALLVLVLALGTAIYLSWRKANKSGEKFYNATTKRVVSAMAVPLIAGGLLMLAVLLKGLVGLIAPFSLIFYGLALYNTSKFTYDEVKTMGLVEIGLGLTGTFFIGYGLFCWALGFGVVHIVYGIYLHYKYER
ncbi:hypothetical protein [Niastella populi]|uniref:Uncharacterized protein n=1 Tax=Niastella populi TaxID=550983 RepID=A0A1V9FH50_9BACT|nr:hypothetical protein [Niastella populi]OQP57591.1 hypothetical protein A4R26_24000 [Niastella populi]